MKTILFNPFKKYQENTLLVIGIIATLLGSLVAYIFFARFDGAIDLHFTPDINLWQPFIDNSINIATLFVVLFVLAKYHNKKTRAVDILNAVLIARIPYYLVPLLNINNTISKATDQMMAIVGDTININMAVIPVSSLIIISVFALISLVALVWYIILLFNGYKIASNAKGGLTILFFCLALILAEIMTKVIIVNFPY
ncbi:hypothetical protein [Cellulophaga sp. Hel_I_12]|uniref:hypothetical protein n=1 Tax=Cellulophaga sp. Hel_I_12 TaxID=1249972 RepID=UPI0006457D1C|nr:hypothetical protein [Cellulophaga sp. Hel_I_12]